MTDTLSRVHELARMDTLGLRGLYLSIAEHRTGGLLDATVDLWDRDRLITAIRNIEMPDGGRTARAIRVLAAKGGNA